MFDIQFDPVFIIFIAGVPGFLLLIIGIVLSSTSDRTEVKKRLNKFIDKPNETRQKKQASTPLTDWLNRRVEKSSAGEKISKNLARADLKMRLGEYIATMIIFAFIGGLLGWLIGGKSAIVGIICMGIGFFLPRIYVKRQQAVRLVKFDDQLPDMLNLMVNGLRAGYSTMQAMDAVSKELPPPICDEFRRVVQEMQLGIPMERSLDNLLRRIPSPDLDLCITAINVQREVGGNLAEILDTISHTIRERVRIKGEIRVMTTQVMYSGRFLALMPFIVIAILYLLNRDYMMEFFKPENRVCGSIALVSAGLLIIAGYFTMNKLADIEV